MIGGKNYKPKQWKRPAPNNGAGSSAVSNYNQRPVQQNRSKPKSKITRLKLQMIQDAYLDGYGDNVYYTAAGYPIDHPEDRLYPDYRVIWQIYDDIDINTLEDENWACDWDKYDVYKGSHWVGNQSTIKLYF